MVKFLFRKYKQIISYDGVKLKNYATTCLIFAALVKYVDINTHLNAVTEEEHYYWFALARSVAWVGPNVNDLKFLNETSGRG